MLKQLPLDQKKVLVRVDFNVPLDENGAILDNSRIVATLPTLQYLLDKKCSLILMSHLGRPKGPTSDLSLKPVATELARVLNRPVKMAPDCVGVETAQLAANLKNGEVLLLENLRFHAAEEYPEKDPNFAKQLASYADFYVDDAFGCAHRAHASVVDVAKLFPGKAAAGFLLEKEITFLGQLLENPKRPFLALIGGAKISTKMGVLKALLKQVDALAVGGGMAFTFLKAQGYAVGNSLVEEGFIEEANNIIAICQKQGIPLLLPVDFVIAQEVSDEAKTQIVDIKNGIPSGFQGLDIGPETVRQFQASIEKASTILWNGPMGVFEKKPFAKGTHTIAEAFASSGAITIAGGGETIAALQKTALKSSVTHISTGGGATLEFLEFGSLPGIEVIRS